MLNINLKTTTDIMALAKTDILVSTIAEITAETYCHTYPIHGYF